MQLISLNCNHCGAPLEVPAKTRFLTCSYCQSRLEVHTSGNAVYSEVLEAIGERTEKIAEDVEALKLHTELEELDRQWTMGLDRYKVRDQDGHYRVPSGPGSMIGAALAAVFGLFWTGMTIHMGAPWFFPVFGVVFIVAAIVGGLSAVSKAEAYQRQRASHESRRRALLRRIQNRE